MAVDFGTGDDGWYGSDDQVAQESRFKAGSFELVSRTFTVWFRRIFDYVLVAGALIAALYASMGVVLITTVGETAAGDVLDVVTADPSSVVMSLIVLASQGNSLLIHAVVMAVVSIIVGAIAVGAAIRLSLWDYGSPGQGTVQESLEWSASNVGRIVGATLAVGLVTGALVAPMTMWANLITSMDAYEVMIFLQANGNLVIMSFVLVIAAVYIAVRLTPIVAVIAAEDLGIVDALKRSYELTSRQFWHVLISRVLLMLGVGIVAYLMSLLVMAAIPGVPYGNVLAQTIVSLVLAPINYVFIGVLYKDLRAREAEYARQWW